MTDKVEVKSISMYPQHWAILWQLAKDLGLGSISAAARYVIADWQRLREAERAGRLAPSNGHFVDA